MTDINLTGRGLRGESLADILRRTGDFGVLSTDSDSQAMQKLNAEATASAAVAEAASGPNYANTAAGLAATSSGESFAVNNGDGTVTVYLNSAGNAVEQRNLSTVAYIAARYVSKVSLSEAVIATLENPSASDVAAIRRALQVSGLEALKSAVLNFNGNHRVSQEVGAVEQTGIGSSSPGTQKWMTDGHKLWVQGTTRVKAQQVTVTDLPGFSRALRLEVTTAQASIGSDFIRHMSFCAQDDFTPMAWGTARARDMVRYCWVKTSMAGTYQVDILNNARDAAVTRYFTVDQPNEWQLVKTTFVGPTSGTWNSGDLGYRCEVSLAGNTSPNLAAEIGHYFQYTGEVFLPGDYDPGLTDTALLMPSLQANLERCQRYYQKSYNMSTVPGTAGAYNGCLLLTPNATVSYQSLPVRFSTPLATVPTVTLYSTQTGTAGKAYSGNTMSDVTITSGEAGAAGFNAKILDTPVTAEHGLSFHYTADARFG